MSTKHTISKLHGALLDAAVAKAEGYELDSVGAPSKWSPSTLWEQGGPIIEREKITVLAPDERLDQLTVAIFEWTAAKYIVDDFENEEEFEQEGSTPLIAAMRSYVASKFGEEIELPDVEQ